MSDSRLQSSDIVEGDMDDIRQQRRKSLVIMALPGYGERPVGSSVKAVLHRDNLRSGFVVFLGRSAIRPARMVIFPGELQRRLYRFRATVAEKRAIHAACLR